MKYSFRLCLLLSVYLSILLVGLTHHFVRSTPCCLYHECTKHETRFTCQKCHQMLPTFRLCSLQILLSIWAATSEFNAKETDKVKKIQLNCKYWLRSDQKCPSQVQRIQCWKRRWCTFVAVSCWLICLCGYSACSDGVFHHWFANFNSTACSHISQNNANDGNSDELLLYYFRPAECHHENEMRPRDPIRCRECGYRIMYKKRTKRCEYAGGHALLPAPVCFELTSTRFYFLFPQWLCSMPVKWSAEAGRIFHYFWIDLILFFIIYNINYNDQ